MTSGNSNGRVGIIGAYHGDHEPKTNPAMTYIVDKECNDCGIHIYESSDLVIRNNNMINGFIALEYFTNAIIENNDVTHSVERWAWRFKQVFGRASGDTYNGEPFEIALSGAPRDGS